MSDSRPTPKKTRGIPIPSRLREQLEGFQKRLWALKVAEGALAGIIGLAASYLVVFTIDRFVDTPNWIRLILLFLGFAVPAVLLPTLWHEWVWKRRSLSQVAKLLRTRFPRLGDELLGVVELARHTSPATSERLVSAAMEQVDERVKDRDLSEALPTRPYRRWRLAAVATLGVSLFAVLFASGAGRNALHRWVTPWKAVDRYTFARLEPLPEKQVVPIAEPFPLTPELTDTTEWSPREGRVRLPGRRTIEAERLDEGYDFTIPPLKEDGALRVRVGDSRHRIEVTPRPRPELVRLEAIVKLPDYLLYPRDLTIPIRGRTVSILEGASAQIHGETSTELASASSDQGPISVQRNRFETLAFSLDSPAMREISWIDQDGLAAKQALSLRLEPVADEAPAVFAQRPENNQVILTDEVITFNISASDDFGIRQLGLRWHGVPSELNPNPAKGFKVAAAGNPEAVELQATATFSAARAGIAPQTLEIRAFAEDYRPDAEPSVSPVFVLHILDPDQHAKWLTEEFSKWFRSAREVYENEQRLHQTNRDLRELSAAELDSPETRRQIRQQASAESANGRRLGALNEAGRELINQATRNDEFDAERLETWATMMRALDEIAKDRMPSVADLLEQASDASQTASADTENSVTAEANPSQGSGNPSSPPNEAAEGEQQSNDPGKNASLSDSGEPQSGGAADPPSGESSLPSMTQTEQSLDPTDQSESESAGQEPAAPKPPPLSLPSTQLAGQAEEEDSQEKPATESEASQKLSEAVEEQAELLAQFAEVADQLQALLNSLEATTFVKRLKAASATQLTLASDVSETLTSGFGLPPEQTARQHRETSLKTSRAQSEQSTVIHTIQADLEAYYQRKREPIFKNVLDQMKESAIVSELELIGVGARNNQAGRAIAASEYWADTLDRWAEELVAASDCEACQGGDKDSLPPEIVLDVMKILRDETELRAETRELEASRPGLASETFRDRAEPLEQSQAEIRARVDEVVDDITDLPMSRSQFGNEIQLLNTVSDVMRQARGVLARPDTGPEAVAAQTEAIELLLQTNRPNPNSGGGGGSSPGGGGSADGQGRGAALTDIGPGAASATPGGLRSRDGEGSTGKAGRDLPEEFRNGLDQFFNQIDAIP
ncbi:MAG: hypothetical protein AAF236_07345 [Verrucomicrobiota bacterium]